MSEMPRKPSPGDYILSAFNRLMDTVRRERVVAGDGIIVKQLECGKSISAIRQHAPNKAPWFGRQTAADTIRVNKGRWTRNADLEGVGLVLDCGANDYINATVTSDQYLSAVVYRTNIEEFDPRLIPTNVILVASNAADKTTVTAALGGGKYYGGHTVIGKMTAGVWAQLWYGGDITDDEQVGDENSTRSNYQDAHSIERNQYHEHQLSDFIEGTAADALTADDRIVARISTSGGSVLRVKYATPQQIADAAAGTPGTIVPPHNHDGEDGSGGDDVEHANLADIQDQTVGDDHRGNRTAAAGEAHPYIHAAGDATRNAMSGVIGDSGGVQSIAPNARTLDGETTAGSKGWKVTSSAAISLDDFETGALVVAGSVSVGADLQVDDTAFANKLVAASPADAVPDSAIRTDGGVFATGHVRSQAGFGGGTKDGISKTISWEDVNGQVHALEITGGIITDHTVT